MEQVLDMLHKIRKGVEKADWHMVCEGYQDITGENIYDLVVKELSPVEQLQKMVNSKPRGEASNAVIIDECKDYVITSEPPRKLRSNETWDGEKIRRKKKEKLNTSSKKVGTLKTNRVNTQAESLINVSTNIGAGDGSCFAKEGMHTGPVKQNNPVFLDAAQIIGKSENAEQKEDYAKLKSMHERHARPAAEFVDINCGKCGRKFRISTNEIPTAVGSDSEVCDWRCRKCAGKPR